MKVFTVQYIFDCTGKGALAKLVENQEAKERTSADKLGQERTSTDISLHSNDLEKPDGWDQN
jgi:hypothetical protein